MQLYGDTSFSFAGRLPLSRLTVGSDIYAAHGQFVFWNSAADKLSVLERAFTYPPIPSPWAVETVGVSGSECSYSFGGQTSASIDSSATSGTVPVGTGASCIWAASSSAKWLSITVGGFAVGPANLTYSAAANPTTVERSAIITVGNQQFVVTQAAAPVTISPASAMAPWAGVTGNVNVNATTTSFSWSANTMAAWITLTNTSGTGTGSVSYSVAPNNSVYSRTAVIDISGQSFTITQAGVAPAFTFSPAVTPQLPVGPGSYTVAVTVTPADTAYMAFSNSTWITIPYPPARTGNANIGFSLTQNTSTTARTGTITIGSAIFTVTQAGVQVTLTPSAASLPSDGGSGSLAVGLNGFTPWTAVSGTPWITITSGMSGTVPGTVAFTVAANPTTSTRSGTITVAGQVFAITQSAAAAPPPTTPQGLGFIPISPCRIIDTRGESGQTGAFGPPVMNAGTSRDFPIPTGPCGIPASAKAYSVNVTVVPQEPLGFLTLWPTGQAAPFVSTLNSLDGRIVANGAIVPAGTNGAISVYVTNKTHVIIDVNGYFDPSDPNGLGFAGGLPCRLVDTRGANGALGGPALEGYTPRTFPLQTSTCVPYGTTTQPIPSSVKAYWLNATVVPSEPLGYLTVWPGGAPQPYVSTLNSLDGGIVANAAIVPRGPADVAAMSTGKTHLVLDLMGYFVPFSPGTVAHKFYPITPCRLLDTRLQTDPNGPVGGPSIKAGQLRGFPLSRPSCGNPPNSVAEASINITAIPKGPSLGYLTVWPAGNPQPPVSNLNSPNGRIVSNSAVIFLGDVGSAFVYSTDDTDLVVDINGYFAP